MTLRPRLLRSYASVLSSSVASAGYLGQSAWVTSSVAPQRPLFLNQSHLRYLLCPSSLKLSSFFRANSFREIVGSVLELLARLPLPRSVSLMVASFPPCSLSSSFASEREL